MDGEDRDQNDTVSSPSLNEETIATKRQKSIKTIITSHSLPTLPFDIVEEILCRLPVKSLLQLRCICKSWNSLISNPKFAKNHLRLSAIRHLHILSYPYSFYSEPSIPISFPLNLVGSCNGILCLADIFKGIVRLWNPSIKKFKELPPIEEPQNIHTMMMCGFGYDSVNDNYKVVVVLFVCDIIYNFVKLDVKIHTLGTNFWKSISEFPFSFGHVHQRSGIFVVGKMIWLVEKDDDDDDNDEETQCFIVSLDIRNESSQKVLLPDYGEREADTLYLGVLRDCLCMICGHDVWLMKEYGNKESWTKLFTISYIRDHSNPYALIQAIYIFEDDQVLLKSIFGQTMKLILYNCRNGTFKVTAYEHTPQHTTHVFVDSLISPCF